jgi:hypothetical protein
MVCRRRSSLLRRQSPQAVPRLRRRWLRVGRRRVLTSTRISPPSTSGDSCGTLATRMAVLAWSGDMPASSAAVLRSKGRSWPFDFRSPPCCFSTSFSNSPQRRIALARGECPSATLRSRDGGGHPDARQRPLGTMAENENRLPRD